MPKRTAKEIEAILCAEKYSSAEEAIAAAQALSELGDEVCIHAADCKVDGDTDDGCTCDPVVIVHRADLARA